MNIYDVLREGMNSNTYGAITLGQLIDTLEEAEQSAIITDGFADPNSWRGVYAFLAFVPEKGAVVADMLKHARSAVGQTFEGYKGDNFTMTRSTPCFIAGWGECSFGNDDAITPERLKRMLGVDVVEKRASQMPERPHILEAHQSIGDTWGIFIPDSVWDDFKSYVCKLEAIAAKVEG